ncbi:MAG TPA: hypothetical protein VF988_14100, partial [Verrucomicrobiae bacterium]
NSLLCRLRRWQAGLAALFLFCAASAGAGEASRFLLVFETSPAVKKSLPATRQILEKLFAGNLQGEIQDNDDLAVWTVDQSLHPGSFPLASWDPDDAEVLRGRLNEFLGQQKFTRGASLAALQPLLNRVVKNSERLTVLIFCDSQSPLLGTPYDHGVNQIITNATARTKASVRTPFVLVLRSYHGEYLGCSVNRGLPLNFPKFPPPPKPQPLVQVTPTPMPLTPAPGPAAATPPPKSVAVPAPVVTPVPALIIIGTNFSTNIAAATKSIPVPVPAPPPAPVVTNLPEPVPTNVAVVTATNPPTVATPTEPVKPAPKPAPAPVVLEKTSAAPAVATAPAPTAPVAPSTRSSSVASNAVPATASAEQGSLLPWLVAGGVLVVVVVVALTAVLRSRRARGSLITSSMQNDPRLPRK